MNLIRLKQTLRIMTILIAAGLTGCTKTISIPGREVRVPPTPVIERVTLADRGEVQFDETGGRYLQRIGLIQGVSTEGARENLKVGAIDSVYFTFSNDTAHYIGDGRTFAKEQETLREDRIKGTITAVNLGSEEIRFDSKNGHVDSLNSAIVGVTSSGELISVPIDSVHSLKVKRQDKLKTFLLLGGVAAVAVVLATANYGPDEDTQIDLPCIGWDCD
ncbi:MAG: hypothetical protein JSU74_13435 [Candidatus Zixiibacteriota bacterium]|nr:MAG: hypothetical protein JSU74_13435 [candidate division Zixibacteria bacterium]